MKGGCMEKMTAYFSVFAAAFFFISTAAFAADKPASYIAIKGGVLSFNKVDFTDQDIKIDLDTKDGYGGELAIGYNLISTLAIELEGGYFEIKNSDSSARVLGDIKLKVIPALVTLKLLIPLGPVEPFGEIGGGAYFTKVEADNERIDISSSTETSYGLHAGAGLNINVTNTFFLGGEWRYIWARQSANRNDIEIDGYMATGVLGLRF
jgi:opacity protein-like surface antigen